MVQQDDRWYCEGNGQSYEHRVRRYIVRAKLMDFTGEVERVIIYNEQVRPLTVMCSPTGCFRCPYALLLLHRASSQLQCTPPQHTEGLTGCRQGSSSR